LSFRIRRRQTAAESVMSDRRTADHTEHGIAIALGVFQTFKRHHTTALTAQVAISRCVESARLASRGKGLEFTGEDVGRRRTNRIDAANERLVAVALLETLTGQVNGDQRRRTGSVDRDTGALKAKVIRQSTAEKTTGGSSGDVGVQIQKRIAGLVLVVVMHPSNKHTSRFRDGSGLPTGALERFVADFHQQALLRIDPSRLAR